jgi:uncharacterized caspase-like protein
MQRLLKTLAFLAFAFLFLPQASAAASEKRLALVIGNASYKAKTLATPVNDAALIAQTLQAAGFDIVGARDLDDALLRQTFRDFVDHVAKAGPDAVAAVYFAGYGLQFGGENYLVPIDANITEASDVPVRAVRLSEQLHALAALHLKTFIILDMARAGPFLLSGLAGGLAWVEPEANMLIAFNAAPGTVAPDVGEGYGPYAKALAEMIREGNLTPANVFDRVRLRVNELTKGAQVPWDASNIEAQFKFFERAPGAPPRADSPELTARMRSQPMRSLGAHDAYMVALMRDTFDAYGDFLADYWLDPMTNRVRALLAARREAITWRRTYQANVPESYWSYLERYPRGPHLADARRLLTHLGAAIEPPSKFARLDYDVPPPLPDELEYVERSVLAFDDPAFAFEQPQPSPAYFLAPPPAEFLALVPPAILPAPMFVSLPAYVSVAAAQPNPFTSANAHERPVFNISNDVPTKPAAQAATSTPSSTDAVGKTNSPTEGPHLPPWVGPKAASINSQGPPPPVASEEIKATPSPPLPTVSLTPQWLPDAKTLSDPGIQPHTLRTDSGAPVPVPTRLAPPSTSMPLRTWRNATPSATGNVPLPVPRSVALARPQTGLLQRTPRAEMLPPQTSGSIPPSVTPAPPPVRNRSKPVANAGSPSETDRAEQPSATPRVASGVAPPKPQKKPCPIVDGIRVCS